MQGFIGVRSRLSGVESPVDNRAVFLYCCHLGTYQCVLG
jgi:hypothetical protein